MRTPTGNFRLVIAGGGAGAPVTPEAFNPVIHDMPLTEGKPRYLTAQIAGGHGFRSEIRDTLTWPPPGKIVARYLALCLDGLDRERTPSYITLTSDGPTTDQADVKPGIAASVAST